jgi:hypothetical protein
MEEAWYEEASTQMYQKGPDCVRRNMEQPDQGMTVA